MLRVQCNIIRKRDTSGRTNNSKAKYEKVKSESKRKRNIKITINSNIKSKGHK